MLPFPLKEGSQVCELSKEIVVEKREVALEEEVREGDGLKRGVYEGKVEEEGDREGSGVPLEIELK
jgi:hypothetical protein